MIATVTRGRLVSAMVAALVVAGGCGDGGLDDTDDEHGDPPWGASCTSGKCDGDGDATLLICGPRDVATARPGCTKASATDIGVDPVTPERTVELHVATQGVDYVGVYLALVLYDAEQRVVRTIALDENRDGAHLVRWDGHDDAGNDVVAPLHFAVLEARYGEHVLSSNEHVIGTMINLPDEADGYNHPLGTDAPDTDDWGRVHVVNSLMQVGEQWPYETPFAVLDLSLRNGGEFKPHWTHRHGECVDLRYVRNDGEGKLDLRWGKSYYDRAATQQLVDLLVAQGAIEVFADRRAELVGDHIVLVAGHTNHFHATFGMFEGDTGADRVINQGRAGGPCQDDSDCNQRDGFCLRPEGVSVGTCTVECEKRCDDYIGGIYTMTECVDIADGRLCMPARDAERYPATGGCRDGLVPQQLASLDQQGALADVCVPAE